MANVKNVELPNIGDFDEVEVIEVLVKKGDNIAKEDSIITLESDKASMEIPSPYAGSIQEVKVKVGDKLKLGAVILTIADEELAVAKDDKEDSQQTTTAENADTDTQPNDTQEEDNAEQNNEPSSEVIAINVPNIGDFDEVEVIEVLVKKGDSIVKEDSMITLESDKASMEIPTTHTGVVQEVKVKVGDKLKLGEVILTLATTSANSAKVTQSNAAAQATKSVTNNVAPVAIEDTPVEQPIVATGASHASPSVRKLARELGVDLSKIVGSGNKNRILGDDLKQHVKKVLTSGGANGGAIPKIAKVDFSKFGEITVEPLSRINKISAKHLSACWLNVPHVTQFDEANIGEMENFRKEQKAKGVKLTPLVFIMKAVVQALKQYPRFNSSLDENGENIILKKYYNLGVAMDTPNGLVVPVIRDVDKKSLTELSAELEQTSVRARASKLKIDDIQGAGFTISSLGGIGGTNFSPIVNAPEVAILGVSRTQIKPIWDGENFVPTPMLPLALSYDHRVIDGAEGARFITNLSSILTDIREILL